MELMNTLRTLKSFVGMVKDPTTTKLDNFFDVVSGLTKKEGKLADAIIHYKTTIYGQAAYEDKIRIGEIDYDFLRTLPTGTLGREYCRFIEDNKLDKASFHHFPDETDHQYTLAHLFETHDIWHVAFGFPPNLLGEYALQGCYMAQCPGRVSPMLISAGLMNITFNDIKKGKKRMAAISRGFTLGANAIDLFGFDWANHWATDLNELRELLQIDLQTQLDHLWDYKN